MLGILLQLDARQQAHEVRADALPSEAIQNIVVDHLMFGISPDLWHTPRALGDEVERLAATAIDNLIGQRVAVWEGRECVRSHEPV